MRNRHGRVRNFPVGGLPVRVGVREQRKAYEDLLRRYLPALRRLARSYSPEAVEQEDLLQEIALGLWTALPRFRGDASERTWLYRVAHNTAISFVSGRKRRNQREQGGDPPDLPTRTLNPESAVIQDQERARLWEAVDELPLADRQILVLHFEGLSAAEIETVTGLSAGNIATRLTRLRQKLVARVRGGEPV
jgi:RNA polymerase sigma factor (sigma-70 family)